MKNLKKLGKVLEKKEQKSVNGGGVMYGCKSLENGDICAGGYRCCKGDCISFDEYNVTNCENPRK